MAFEPDMATALARLQKPQWQVCLLNFQGEGFSAAAFLQDPAFLDLDLPVVVIIPPDHLGEVRLQMATLGASDCLVGLSLEVDPLAHTLTYARIRAQSLHSRASRRFSDALSGLPIWQDDCVQGTFHDPVRLANTYPPQFAELAEEYESLMEFAASEPASDTHGEAIGHRLAMIADRLLYFSAHALDVVDLYQEATRLQQRRAHAPAMQHPFCERSATMLMGLLGNLCMHYRQNMAVSRRLEAAASAQKPG